jgi:hypothetical protein
MSALGERDWTVLNSTIQQKLSAALNDRFISEKWDAASSYTRLDQVATAAVAAYGQIEDHLDSELLSHFSPRLLNDLNENYWGQLPGGFVREVVRSHGDSAPDLIRAGHNEATDEIARQVWREVDKNYWTLAERQEIGYNLNGTWVNTPAGAQEVTVAKQHLEEDFALTHFIDLHQYTVASAVGLRCTRSASGLIGSLPLWRWDGSVPPQRPRV